MSGRVYNRRFWYAFAAWLLAYLVGVFAGKTDWPWWAFFLLATACAMVFFELLNRREKAPS